MAGLLFPPWVLADTTASASKKEVLVRCDAGQKIGWALSKLDKMRPNVVRVSGACQENVDISGFDDLTIVGKPGATLLPVPPVTAHAIGVWASHLVSIEGLTIRITDGRTAFGLVACYACILKNGFCNDLAMPSAWGACMDVGGKFAGTYSGSMNMMGNFGGVAGPIVVGYILQTTGHNWALTFYVSAAVYVVGALLWLFVDPVTPLDRPPAPAAD